MATQKEMEAVAQVIEAAARVNASSGRVDVTVTINKGGVNVFISDPVVVLANCQDNNWDWLFYEHGHAYFSGDVFMEDAFIARCQEYVSVINGFEGYAVSAFAFDFWPQKNNGAREGLE